MTYQLRAFTVQELEAKAAETVRVVKYPERNELFVDLDTTESYDAFVAQYAILKTARLATDFNASDSRTPGHMHIVVTLSYVPSPFERVALQAALGSDRKRELLAILQAKDGTPGPNVFFEVR